VSLNAEINRIDIALQGVSADLASAATDGLDAEIRRRIGALRIDQGLLDRANSVDISELAIGPVNLRAGSDAVALRGVLAERIVEALRAELQAAGEDDL
jgi:hypothetical protein